MIPAHGNSPENAAAYIAFCISVNQISRLSAVASIFGTIGKSPLNSGRSMFDTRPTAPIAPVVPAFASKLGDVAQ
jgi:hypothetical protein